jgi:peptidoglycan hydrolase CwlO-like protein
MEKNGKRIVLFVTFLILFLGTFFVIKAADDPCLSKSGLDKINCYDSLVSQYNSQAKTLSSQIAQFDAQIKLTTLKIQQTQDQIDLLGGRIDQLEVSLESLTQAFSSRAVETYKLSKFENNFAFVLTASDVSDAVVRFHYLQKIQEEDRNLLNKLQEAQTTYIGEKQNQESLQKQLKTQQANLSTQKAAKNALLSQTKNDEKKYQMLLAQALAEKAAIDKALVSGVKVGPVKAGDPIALIGNSGYPGCSTGKHLHFEVRKDNTWVDPSTYLQNKTVNDEENGGTASIGSGNWQWPVQDTIRLTQHFGHTPWSWRYSYSGGIHTGFDMVSTSSDVIRAPADGNLFKSAESCGGSTINIVYIEHGNGIISLYLHVQ